MYLESEGRVSGGRETAVTCVGSLGPKAVNYSFSNLLSSVPM